MRRKVLQDFANVFCQKFIQLPSGYDLATFAHYGSGNYHLDILNEKSFLNDKEIPILETCEEHKEWLFNQTQKHNIHFEQLKDAYLKISVAVSEIQIKEHPIQNFASAYFKFKCESEIKTDEKVYSSKISHKQLWEFGWFYEKLYGSVTALKK